MCGKEGVMSMNEGPGIDEVNGTIDSLCKEIQQLEKERDYWHNLCDSYERTILALVEGIADRGDKS